MNNEPKSAKICRNCRDGKAMRGEDLCWKCYRDQIREELGRPVPPPQGVRAA